MFPLPHGDPFLVVVGYEAEVIVGTFRVRWTVGMQVLVKVDANRAHICCSYSC